MEERDAERSAQFRRRQNLGQVQEAGGACRGRFVTASWEERLPRRMPTSVRAPGWTMEGQGSPSREREAEETTSVALSRPQARRRITHVLNDPLTPAGLKQGRRLGGAGLVPATKCACYKLPPLFHGPAGAFAPTAWRKAESPGIFPGSSGAVNAGSSDQQNLAGIDASAIMELREGSLFFRVCATDPALRTEPEEKAEDPGGRSAIFGCAVASRFCA